MIRVAFRYGDKGWLARFICWWQDWDASHCETASTWSGDVHYCVSSSIRDGGVRGKVIALPASKWRIYEVDGSPAAVLGWLELHKGERYDFPGLLGFAFRRIKGWLRAWFCSEAAADMLGYTEPHRFDLALLEGVCARHGRRIQ